VWESFPRLDPSRAELTVERGVPRAVLHLPPFLHLVPPVPQSELRQDLITEEWVICAPERSNRPRQFSDASDASDEGHGPVDGCPFCPGHEHMLPEVLFEWSPANANGHSAPAAEVSPSETPAAEDSNGEGSLPWHTRSVPNKYPALEPVEEREAYTCMMYRSRPGHGRQEVIITSPRHRECLARMPVVRVESVLRTYQHRYHALREQGLVPIIFHNHGASAGASLTHPHSQIIAPEIEPPQVLREENRASRRFRETGQCLYCEMIEQEIQAEARVVYRNDAFVVFVPYAARDPYEMWILPLEHQPEFGLLNGTTSGLAEALRAALRSLHRALGDPDFNFYVRSALEYESDASHLHWSLRIRPRMSIDAGFEIGTGIKVNPSLPERDADVLREALA